MVQHTTTLDWLMSAHLVSGVIIPGVWLKQVVPRGELEGHTGGGPDVCRGMIAGAQEDLQGPILPGLDVLRVVVRYPARVTQVGYLALKVRHNLTDRILENQFIKYFCKKNCFPSFQKSDNGLCHVGYRVFPGWNIFLFISGQMRISALYRFAHLVV